MLGFVGVCCLQRLRANVLCMHAVVNNIAVAGGPGSLCKGRQSYGKLHRVQDLRKEATAGVGVYVQLLLGVACEMCGSHPHCLVLMFLGQCTVPCFEHHHRGCVLQCAVE